MTVSTSPQDYGLLCSIRGNHMNLPAHAYQIVCQLLNIAVRCLASACIDYIKIGIYLLHMLFIGSKHGIKNHNHLVFLIFAVFCQHVHQLVPGL